MSYLKSIYKKLSDNVENDSSESTDDDCNGAELKKEQKIKTKEISIEHQTKFDLLKQKRLQIKEKFDRKMKKFKSNEKLSMALNGLRAKNNCFTEIDDLDNSKNEQSCSKTNEESFSGNLTVSLEDLEYKMDKALEEKNIELAEHLSEQIYATQTQQSLQKEAEVEKFKQELKLKEQAEKKKRKPLNWRFEAKKRWESKSNM